jgi:hypothetical protein
MSTVFVMLGGILLVVWIVLLLDWFGRRKEKHSRASS